MATYKDSGVDITAGEETVDRIKPLVSQTHNKNVLTGIGLFGGFYDAKFPEYHHPVLVSSTDGVGTKLKVAFMMEKHTTVGQDLVNHCTDDILCCGAKPLFFLDYFATGKLNPSVAEKVISGFAIACQENNCALIGGETAEMPSIYADGEYDISGTIVGIVEKEKILDGKRINKGDQLIGLTSTGLHTNGYSLARHILFPKYKPSDRIESLGTNVGDALLAIHRSYLKSVYPLCNDMLLSGISHITGGGIIGNTKRIVRSGLEIKIEWDSWQQPEIFRLIQNEGKVSDDEMRNTFNLGIGMILIVPKDKVDIVLDRVHVENPILIGEIT